MSDTDRIKDILRVHDLHEETCARQREATSRREWEVRILYGLPECNCWLSEDGNNG